MLFKLCAAMAALCLKTVTACDDHDWTSPMLGGYVNHDLMKRHDLDKRIQPGALPTLPQQIKVSEDGNQESYLKAFLMYYRTSTGVK